jgi:long-chain acyl-CoA synthetase
MTECAPIACANRPDDNVPASVGRAIPGVDVKLGAHDALLIRGPNVMLGYWGNVEATRAIISGDGWLNSGDTARIDAQGHVYITGRLKEIIVTSTGEKIAPVDVESAILRDPLFDQAMLVGEAKPFLTVVAVLNTDQWSKVAASAGLSTEARELSDERAQKLVLDRIRVQLKGLPGYADVRRAVVTVEPWTIENGLLTPTMKLKRNKVCERFDAEIDRMYAGH